MTVQKCDQPDLPSDNSYWETWRNEQARAITQILSSIFKVEGEVQQTQSPSRLLGQSLITSPEERVKIVGQLNQIREQITEYEHLLKISRTRIESALEKINPDQKKISRLQKFINFFRKSAIFS